MPAPNCTISAQWQEAWVAHELHMLAEGLAGKTITSRKASFNNVARHACHAGIEDPAEVTKSWLMSYMAAQFKERKGLGPITHYQNLAIFFRMHAEEYGCANPMTGIPRPRASSPPPTSSACRI